MTLLAELNTMLINTWNTVGILRDSNDILFVVALLNKNTKIPTLLQLFVTYPVIAQTNII